MWVLIVLYGMWKIKTLPSIVGICMLQPPLSISLLYVIIGTKVTCPQMGFENIFLSYILLWVNPFFGQPALQYNWKVFVNTVYY